MPPSFWSAIYNRQLLKTFNLVRPTQVKRTANSHLTIIAAQILTPPSPHGARTFCQLCSGSPQTAVCLQYHDFGLKAFAQTRQWSSYNWRCRNFPSSVRLARHQGLFILERKTTIDAASKLILPMVSVIMNRDNIANGFSSRPRTSTIKTSIHRR